MKKLNKSSLLLTFYCIGLNIATAQWTDGGSNVYVTTSYHSVGVGTSSPTSFLHVTDLTGSASPSTNGVQIWGGINSGFDITGTSAAYIDLKNDVGTGDYDARFILVGNDHLNIKGTGLGIGYAGSPSGTMMNVKGSVGIGTSTPSGKFQVTEDEASNFAAYFFNDGNNANRYGIQITCGANDQTGATDNYYLRCYDGDGHEQGGLKVNTGTMSIYNTSDRRLKTNITNTKINGMDILKDLRVVDYNWKSDPLIPKVTGFIAQEIREVYPKMTVESPENGMLSITPGMLIPILVKGVQEQQNVIDRQESIITKQGKRIKEFRELLSSQRDASTTQTSASNDLAGIVLNQNDPNPFVEQTAISYFIPDNIRDAQIWVFDNSGRVRRKINISEKGNGKIIIYASDLSTGIYTYSLVSDGITLESKKMVLTK